MNGAAARRISGWHLIWMLISLIVVAIGGITGLYGWVFGQAGMFGSTREMTMGVCLIGYLYFVGITTGLCVIGALGHLFGFDTYEPATSRAAWLAIMSLLAGFFCILWDLGHPVKAVFLFIFSANLSAPIMGMAIFYASYVVFAAVEFILLMRKKYGIAVVFGGIALVLDVIARANVGFVFGSAAARPFYVGPFPSFFFLALSMTSGIAVFLLATTWISKLRGKSNPSLIKVATKVQIVSLCVVALFYMWYIISGKFGLVPGKYEAVKALYAGPLSLNFWLFEIICGIVLPLILYASAKGKSATITFIASILVIAGTYVAHYDFTMAGQIVSVLHPLGMTTEHSTMYLSYTPKIAEWLIIAGGYGVLSLLFLLGEAIFKFPISEKAE